MPWIEFGTFILALGVALASYFIVSGAPTTQRLLSPPLVALLLVGNLVPGIALLVLIGRRVAKKRAQRSVVGGGGRLHVRLVATFSLIAAVPMLLVVIFASLLFQYGVEFWFSDRARGMLENAAIVAQEYNDEYRTRVLNNTVAMGSDIVNYLDEAPIDTPLFQQGFAGQVYQRELSEAAIIVVTKGVGEQTLAMVDPYDRGDTLRIKPELLVRLRKGESSIVTDSGDRIEAVTRLGVKEEAYLWAARVVDPKMLAQSERAQTVSTDYRRLLERSRALQLQFNIALLAISLLIVGAAVWIALAVADRLVRPVGDLVDAAQRIAEGDLSARVPQPVSEDEIGRLANAFNRMAHTIDEQTSALDSRRAFIEAVLSSVTAGVISIDHAHKVRLINSSAAALLKSSVAGATGQALEELAPELDALAADEDRNEIVQINAGGDPRTLAVKVVRDEAGHVLTFDDITQQVLDQRRAAWADVARRIAHEIKNPLTPIQLAAERLQRRYGKQVEDDPSTFARLTETIIRQVSDLRRMVDEFSSFARMPKPVFRSESITDIARQALFLHEVAHPDTRFSLEQDADQMHMVCDRRQIGQALTNIVKNAVEAIEQKKENDPEFSDGKIVLSIATQNEGRQLTICIADNGIGLPQERDRLVEPYVTTRSRGTGLGLAIVKKIVEEHFGKMSFADNPGGGTVIEMTFDTEILSRVISDENAGLVASSDDAPLTKLTHKRSS
ncbi:ATP-binding protein [Sphingomonas sp. C3-2]|uniref:sensor histidine kinase n=1 Tax=Sphingomonas sp. C3-2 TaxID=3062169 RepID=UPI00294B8149|nr:ATP-binding protein [Sphingomonas sp. C3-2]WOK36892.1 ATP-binding protein [Sphingomonas sp. C3-2]